MSGFGQLWIPPSEFISGGVNAYSWARGIPAPGGEIGPAVSGIATCQNLLSDSPPTLLERYELYSLAIETGSIVGKAGGFPTPPNISVELALLVNDRVAYVATQQAQGQEVGGTTTEYSINFLFAADLVNSIRLDARDRLSLRTGIMCDQIADVAANVAVAANTTGLTNKYQAVESTISYNVDDLPARRRL